MTILEIEEEENKTLAKQKPIKEKMNIYLEDIPEGISRKNGMIYVITGSGGSGKSSMLLGQFRKGSANNKPGAYYRKFDHLYYFCPSVSFESVSNHPFKKHDKVYHELTVDALEELLNELKERKEANGEAMADQEYNMVIIDDFASDLKNKEILKILNQMFLKARHLNTSFVILTQVFNYIPLILRKQITYCTIFKPRSGEEIEAIRKELLHMKQEDAEKIFDYVFNEPYQHLDIDAFEGKLYKNFNLLKIKKK